MTEPRAEEWDPVRIPLLSRPPHTCRTGTTCRRRFRRPCWWGSVRVEVRVRVRVRFRFRVRVRVRVRVSVWVRVRVRIRV